MKREERWSGSGSGSWHRQEGHLEMVDRFEPYVPLKAGSIDGTDHRPHDRAVVRAMNAEYDASLDKKIVGDPRKTLFVARLNYKTTEETLRSIFEQYGPIEHFRLVRDIVTGYSRGYAFITYKNSADFKKAWKETHKMVIDDHSILVEQERERLQEGWVPRRLGGGLGGRKESGQLRFGGRDRPFRPPFHRPSSNPLEVEGIHNPQIGVVAGIKFDGETEERHVYLKQKGKNVIMQFLDEPEDYPHHKNKKHKEGDKERGDGDRERDKERERDRERDKERERDRDRERGDGDRDRDRGDRERDKESVRYRSKEKEQGERESESESHRTRDRGSERNREEDDRNQRGTEKGSRDRNRERHRDGDRHRERHRDKHKDKDRDNKRHRDKERSHRNKDTKK